jgi:hypothetical protein
MEVAENEEIHAAAMLLLEFIGKLHNSLILPSPLPWIVFMGKPVVPAPLMCHPESPTGMYSAEHPLKEPVLETPVEKFIPKIALPQTISMSQTEFFPLYLHHIRLGKHPEPQFLRKIIICPDIVVTIEEIHLNPSVNQ